MAFLIELNEQRSKTVQKYKRKQKSQLITVFSSIIEYDVKK